MPIKTKYDASEFEGLKENEVKMSDLFREDDDGNFVLTATAVGGLEIADVDGLQSALRQEKDAVKAAKRQLAPWKKLAEEHDLEPSSIVTKLKEAEKASEGAEDIEAARAQIRSEWEGKLTEERTKREEAEQKLVSQAHDSMIEGLLSDVVPGKRGLMRTHLRAHSKRVEKDGQVSYVALGDSGEELFSKERTAEPRSMKEHVAILRDSDDFADFFLASDVGGDGAGGGGKIKTGNLDDNPFAKGRGFNRTKAGQMLRDEADRAQALITAARAAGKLDPSMERYASTA